MVAQPCTFARPRAPQPPATITVPGEYTPPLNEVRRLQGQGNIVPIFRDVRADLETPVSAYLKVARGP